MIIGIDPSHSHIAITTSKILEKNRAVEEIKIRNIRSFIVGPQTLTFVKLLNDEEEWNECSDHSLYLSLIKQKDNSIDLIFAERNDLINFVVALSALASKHDPHFFAITNRALIANFLLRIKIEQIA